MCGARDTANHKSLLAKLYFVINLLNALTASLFVGVVVTVTVAIAHLGLLDAVLADAAVEVVLGAIGTVELVAKVGAVDDAVANAIPFAGVAEFGDAA
jgi:hypothetical protein